MKKQKTLQYRFYFFLHRNSLHLTFYFRNSCLASDRKFTCGSEHSRHTQPNYLTALKQKLVEEEGVLKKQNASYVFYLNNIFADPKTLKVTLVGERQFFVGGKQTSQEKRAYTLHFKYEGIRLLLNGISEEKDRSLVGGN